MMRSISESAWRLRLSWLVVLFVLALSVPVLAAESPVAESHVGAAERAVPGEIYYTQFSLFHEDQVHETTNYRKRTLVPVNTPVTFVAIQKRVASGNRGETAALKNHEIAVTLPDGKTLRIANVTKYSGENLDGIFGRTLAKSKADLTLFTELERANILRGSVEAGMSKAAVLRAMGYPPKHRTPDLTANDWTYWQNRMASFVVRFENDKVVSTR